jgi:hypothetical protein
MFVSLFDNGHSGLFDDSANSGALFIEENNQLFLFGEILRFNLLDQFPIAFNRKDCHNASMNSDLWKHYSKQMAKLYLGRVVGTWRGQAGRWTLADQSGLICRR